MNSDIEFLSEMHLTTYIIVFGLIAIGVVIVLIIKDDLKRRSKTAIKDNAPFIYENRDNILFEGDEDDFNFDPSIPLL